MKKNILSAGLILLGYLAHAQNGLEKITVEKFYISNSADAMGSSGTLPTGSVTYRVYVDMKAGYKFQQAFGNVAHPLTISSATTFFNNEDRGTTTPNGISVNNTKKNSVMLDSWFSVGAAASGRIGVLKTEDTDGSIGNANSILQNADPKAGIAISSQDGMIAGSPESVTFVGFDATNGVFDATSQFGSTFTTTGGAWASLNGSTGADTTNKVLIGQFTTDGVFTFSLNIQLGTPSGDREVYVAANPAFANGVQEVQFSGLVYASDAATAIETLKPLAESKALNVYPNPATDELTIEIAASKANNNSSYTIYDVLGNVVATKNLGLINDKRTEKVDVSSFAAGMYYITSVIDGVSTTKKIVKK